LKKLTVLVLSLILIFTITSNSSAEKSTSKLPTIDNPNIEIREKGLTIEEIIPEDFNYKALTHKEIMSNEKTRKIYDDLLRNADKYNVAEDVEIYQISPKSKKTVSISSSCDYGFYKYIATSSSYAPYSYNNNVIRSYMKTWWQVYDPPPGHVGNYYKADYVESWWWRTTDEFTVKNANFYLDVQALCWCNYVLSDQINDFIIDVVPWKNYTDSYTFVWNVTSWYNEPPVTTSSDLNFIQTATWSDIYYNGILKKSPLKVHHEPNGL